MPIMLQSPLTVAFLYNQPHTFHTLTVLCAGRDNIDSCRVDAAVSENICEFGDILFDIVKYPCEQMSQIVRKDLFGIHLCFKAEVFISRQMFVRLNGLPVRVTKTAPDVIFCLAMYRSSFFCKPRTIKMFLVFPLSETVACPLRTASTVIDCSSLTRMPVPQIVCKIRQRRSLCFLSAVRHSRSYSAFVSSFSSGQKSCC